MTESNHQLSRFGFNFERSGAHTSRTMMLEELTALLAYVDQPEAEKSDYLQAIEVENCLGKRSGKTRRLTYRHLVDLYSLDRANQEHLAAAEALKKKLELILDGEAPYDIFVRWKPLEQQPIGWNPDLNDGVRFNIRPFLTAPDVGKKGAGFPRDKPNINWNKDRGKDVESAPWYHVFDGDRINDHHLTLAEKRAAREKGKQA